MSHLMSNRQSHILQMSVSLSLVAMRSCERPCSPLARLLFHLRATAVKQSQRGCHPLQWTVKPEPAAPASPRFEIWAHLPFPQRWQQMTVKRNNPKQRIYDGVLEWWQRGQDLELWCNGDKAADWCYERGQFVCSSSQPFISEIYVCGH